MNIVAQNVLVRMRRGDLEGLPPAGELPEGFRIRAFQAGDDQAWVDIHKLADLHTQDLSRELFRREFGADDAVLAERMLFLISPDGRPVGTASAWWDDDYHGEAHGRIHWVAIVPEFQGRGLAKPLLAATCERLRALGHGATYLVTQTARLPAIQLYRKFGFTPDIRTAEDQEIWNQLEPFLKARK